MERHFHHELEALRDRLSEMAGRAETALVKSMEALKTRNPKLAEEVRSEDIARRICERDVEIDGLKAKIFAKLSGGMIQTPESVPRGLELLLVSRNLERVADLATNIAEEAIFVAEARVIKHHAEDAPSRPVGPPTSGSPSSREFSRLPRSPSRS